MSNKPTLYVMIGPAGSGKSVFSKSLFSCRNRVCPDEIRKDMFGDESCQKEPEKVFNRAYTRMEDLLCHGCDVVFDATNTTEFGRKKILERVDAIRCTKVAVYMNTPLEECKRRNAQRLRQVPDEVIDRQYMQMIRDAASIPCQFDQIIIVEGWKMNERLFSIGDFKTLVLRILNAENAHDGFALQKLEGEIADTYKKTTMTHCQYNTLWGLCNIFIDDWRRNYKQ